MNRITLIAVGLTLMFAQTTHAQKNKGGLAINAGAGFSMFGILGSLNFSIKDDFTVESKATPAFVGSFDYAFWLVFFVPLLCIALLHDLRASEQQAGRLLLIDSVGEMDKKAMRLHPFSIRCSVALAPQL